MAQLEHRTERSQVLNRLVENQAMSICLLAFLFVKIRKNSYQKEDY
ncbi:hypothetical protein P799_05300 [Lysinibacillus sphaericus CBAM5]|uniref:Uncharacterized protein n=1 Tax=Lysinibacillus sphaericus CBAM5 TaxID=1400869 RepID=W7S783_LYSSH|nr:hypothetical protein P799_05300 [Lysinibacillus sphaericus CBAM5]